MNKTSKAETKKQLVEIISQPNFDHFIQEIEDQPSNTRLEYAKKVTSVDELKKRGITIPEGLRMTLRTSDGKDLIRDAQHPQALAGGHWSICIVDITGIVYQCFSAKFTTRREML